MGRAGGEGSNPGSKKRHPSITKHSRELKPLRQQGGEGGRIPSLEGHQKFTASRGRDASSGRKKEGRREWDEFDPRIWGRRARGGGRRRGGSKNRYRLNRSMVRPKKISRKGETRLLTLEKKM